jgi:hypothetical protein
MRADSSATIDEDFAAEVEAAIASHPKPLVSNPPEVGGSDV